jgi:hypothetical protein
MVVAIYYHSCTCMTNIQNKEGKGQNFQLGCSCSGFIWAKINYISPVFGFWVIICNQKRVGWNPAISLHCMKYRKTFLCFLFDHAESWQIFAGVSAPYLRKNSPTHSYDIYFFSSREIYVIHGRKNNLISFRTKILHWQVYGLKFTFFNIRALNTVAHSHVKPTNARSEASAASRREMRSSGLLSSEYS